MPHSSDSFLSASSKPCPCTHEDVHETEKKRDRMRERITVKKRSGRKIERSTKRQHKAGRNKMRWKDEEWREKYIER